MRKPRNPSLLSDSLTPVHGFVLSLLLISLFSSPCIHADPKLDVGEDGEAEELVHDAFQAVTQAEERGGNVSLLVEDLNRALALLDKGQVEEAEDLALEVVEEARSAGEAGARAEMWSHFRAGLVVALLLGLSVLVWVYGSEVFWAVWVWLKRNWVVKG